MSRSHAIGAIVAQAAVAIVGMLGIALAPPAQGEMLLLPLTTDAAHRLPALALRDDTLLIARGAVAGSLIVRGSRARLAWRLIANGIVPIASARPGCATAITA